jgi:thiazole synthase
MIIRVNGEDMEIPPGSSLEALLENQGYNKNTVAAGVNGKVVPRGEYPSLILRTGDGVEIFHFMGGGGDPLTLGGRVFTSRFILGSGKYSLALINAAVENAGAEMITVALRRANVGGRENILDYIPPGVTLLPNTSGARTAEEAVKIARFARELGRNFNRPAGTEPADFVKIEVIRDSKYLLPDNYETIKATEILAREGFTVMPYMYPDLNAARDLVNAGAACVMPLAAPIGSNRGLCARDFIRILLEEIELPVIVDAGIGRPSQACEVMEMGAAAVMVNTAIASAGDIRAMAGAFRKAIEAGRGAYLAGLGRVLEKGASASSPLTGFLRDDVPAAGEES